MPSTSMEATSEQADTGGPQLGPSEGGVTYAVVAAGPVPLHKPSGALTPTAKGSNPSEPAVTSEDSP
jgi:hypothetical protein